MTKKVVLLNTVVLTVEEMALYMYIIHKVYTHQHNRLVFSETRSTNFWQSVLL